MGCNKRRPSFSDTELIPEPANMPIGTANPTLKSSFSLTSLRSFTPTDSPENGTPLRLSNNSKNGSNNRHSNNNNNSNKNNNERLYHSLTKKSRKSNEQDKELWRKSWGSGISQDGKEFWEGFQADYDYLMAQNILEKTVSEMSMEKAGTGTTPTAPPVWSHSEFMDQFAQLYSWLKGIQDSVYGKQENVTDWKLRAERQEDMQRQRFRLDTFNEQSKKLTARYPNLEGEVSWLRKHVNDKWETVEGMMGVSMRVDGGGGSDTGKREKVEHEVRCLRRWLRDLDTKLKPLSFQRGWTKAELEMKTKEHMVLHRDIEAHRKIVSSVFKLCEKGDASILVAARALERKYHEYYLRSLEWQYHIESLVGLQVNKSSPSWSNDSDGEPVAKIARFADGGRDSDPGRRESDGGGQVTLEDNNRLFERNNLEMDVASSEVGFGERFSTMEDPDYMERTDDSISGAEDFSSTSLRANSRNCDAFSCGTRGQNATARNFVAGFPTKATVLPSSPPPPPSSTAPIAPNGLTPAEKRPPNTKPPNTGTFSWRHTDTDSDPDQDQDQDQDKVRMAEEEKAKEEMDGGKDGETTSSEENWTYKPGQSTIIEPAGAKRKLKGAVRSLEFAEETPLRKIPLEPSSVQPISRREPIYLTNRKLVDDVDRLYRCQLKPCRSKQDRLGKVTKEDDEEKPLDSGDASWEYTDSDGRESPFSEDNESSTATCKGSGSAEGILDDWVSSLGGKPNVEVILRRNKSAAMRNRPWSMSNVSALMGKSPSLKSRSSLSESSLNQVPSAREKRFFSCQKNGRFTSTEDGTWTSCGSSRKKRTKVRKRPNKRNSSGSDGLTLSGSDSPNLSCPGKQISNLSGIVKSGSFSGVSRKQRDFSPTFKKCEDESGTETDEEPCSLSPPRFRLGPNAGAVTVSPEREKMIQGEEQLSFNSDQAFWDNYQEKYQSEAYSEEPADSDTAKKVLEFGEDYGKYMGNNSDCSSCWTRSPTKARSRSKFDSDSDVDEVKRFLRQSIDQLDLVEMTLNETNSEYLSSNGPADEDSHSKTFLDKIITKCRKNVDSLTQLLNEVNDDMHIPKQKTRIQDVKESWEDMRKMAELHKAKQLRSDMTAIKNEFLNWAAAVESMNTTVTSREELEAKIIQIKNELNSMKKGKSKLLQANVSVHRFLSTAQHVESTLRDEVTELYRVWDQTFSRVSSQLMNLQSLSQAWHDFDDHLSQLQSALRTDTLKVIDFALQCGTSSDVTGSLKDIAGLLSDKEASTGPTVSASAAAAVVAAAATGKDVVVASAEEQAGVGGIPRPLLTALSTEGSLSDSGISDSGSEQEMSEREKKLAQLKRLAKRLEGILAPSSQALSNMFKRIDEAESGLRELQKTCRDLIVRSSSTEEFKAIVSKASNIGALNEPFADGPGAGKPSCRRTKGKGQKSMSPPREDVDGEADKEEGKGSRKSWLWRLVRFALPLQLALVALLCVACLMEPRCCDSLNNLDLSLNPQLRYDSGPPPV